ncbi:GmrSD restriction endonuclease domain-containing protein [Bradyrhizobium sp. HKCCYLRH1030]|uniref:GmrSD restriction endonuclease domain-containing protein n=1 Tax=Bradyrhizobium sp. HKCCYLRH1030 TaxID=3420744 RepID=UPI003EBC0DB0
MKAHDTWISRRSIAKLLRDVDAGKFAVPRLQREFVWDGPKAAKLIDSILRAMPIGLILVWDTPRSQRLHLRQKYHVLPPFNQTNRRVWFLIDGQQRVSVLHHVRQGDQVENARKRDVDFSKVVLSLVSEDDNQAVRYRRPLDGHYISLSTVLHPQWRQKLNGIGKRKLERIREYRRRILDYDVFTMFVHGSLPDIRESFLRINTQGMKVTTADAIFTQAESLNLRDIVHELRQHIDAAFSGIPDEPLLFVLSAIRGGSEARGRAIETRIRRLNKEATTDPRMRSSLARDWNRLGPCVGKAVDYLRERFSVVSREFLASDYMLSMLAFFFFHNGRGPSQKQADEIRKWFWATAAGSRYSGTDFNRCVPADLKFFEALARNRARTFRYDPQIEVVDVRKAQYASRTAITSAVYCMLLRRGPVHLLDKGLNEIPVQRYSTPANRKDRHHIFPRQVLASAGIPVKLYNSISNVCLLVAEENQKIGSKRPSRYVGELDSPGLTLKRKMNRHLIPLEDTGGIWDPNVKKGFRRFLQVRTELICRAMEAEAGIRLFRTERR